MTLRRTLAAFVCGALFLSLVACDGSSGVGANVGDDDLRGGDPQTVALSPTASFDRTDIAPPITGNVQNRDWRILAGRVHDPIAGTATATGYFDLTAPDGLPSSIANASRFDLRAELRFEPQYLHGDTTASVEVALYDLAENPDFSGARNDATFPDSAQVEGTFTISADADTLVTIPLPDSWLRDHLAQLRDTSTLNDGPRFNRTFKGFRIEARSSVSDADPGAVIGFSADDSELRLVRTDDTDGTASYPVISSFSSVSWTDPPADGVPPNRVLLRGGDDRALEVDFDLSSEAATPLLGAPLNRVQLDLPLDSAALESDVPDFVRPSIEGLRLLMRRNTDDDVPACESSALGNLNPQTEQTGLDPQDEAGAICFVPLDLRPLPQRLTSTGVFSIVERSLQPGRAVVFDAFRIELADRFTPTSSFSPAFPGVPTTAPVLFHTPGTANADDRPRLNVVATPL